MSDGERARERERESDWDVVLNSVLWVASLRVLQLSRDLKTTSRIKPCRHLWVEHSRHGIAKISPQRSTEDLAESEEQLGESWVIGREWVKGKCSEIRTTVQQCQQGGTQTKTYCLLCCL